MDILKVSAQSDASATAGALANTIRESGEAELQGIGPKAINQAIKAIAIARSYLASSGVDLVAMPSFVDVEIDGEQRTALRFSIVPRHRLHQSHEDGHLTESELESESTSDATEDGEAPSPEREPEPTEEEGDVPEKETVPSRPTSLSEAIRGRPASGSDAPGDDEASSDASERTDDADDESDSDEVPTERRASFFGRSRRSEVDTDRDVF